MRLIVSVSAILDERNFLSFLYHVLTVTCSVFLGFIARAELSWIDRDYKIVAYFCNLFRRQNFTFPGLIVRTELQLISGIDS